MAVPFDGPGSLPSVVYRSSRIPEPPLSVALTVTVTGPFVSEQAAGLQPSPSVGAFPSVSKVNRVAGPSTSAPFTNVTSNGPVGAGSVSELGKKYSSDVAVNGPVSQPVPRSVACGKVVWSIPDSGSVFVASSVNSPAVLARYHSFDAVESKYASVVFVTSSCGAGGGVVSAAIVYEPQSPTVKRPPGYPNPPFVAPVGA